MVTKLESLSSKPISLCPVVLGLGLCGPHFHLANGLPVRLWQEGVLKGG